MSNAASDKSYTASGGVGGMIAEFRELARSAKIVAKRYPDDARKLIRDCRYADEYYEKATGKKLEGLDCLEIGCGQMLAQATYFAKHNNVLATDLEVYARGFDIPVYMGMLKRNGPKRVLKTVVRKMIGLDSGFMTELRKQLGVGPEVNKRLRFQQCDATNMPFADNSFDLAYSINVFEHLPDPRAVFRNFKRVIKPGGCIFTHLHLYTSDSGCHDLRIIRGDHDQIAYWPHLRPAHENEVRNLAYLNRISFDEWHTILREELPGATIGYVTEEHLRPEMEKARSTGDLKQFRDEELLTKHILCMWRKQ